SQKDPFDPTEKAIREMGEHYLPGTEHLHRDWELAREYPLSRKLLALSNVWISKDREPRQGADTTRQRQRPGVRRSRGCRDAGQEFVIAAKGAPEAIADLCHLDAAAYAEIADQADKLADEGLRVLGVASAGFSRGELPGEQHDFIFKFLGMVGLADPVRPSAPEALKECSTAGIRLVMITGDYPRTALNIARQLGMSLSNGILTGPEMDSMSEEELRNRIKKADIFARVVPEQKLRIVNALKANGEIVAMTGDGVNDAPALKSANIGIAMGGRGTDVARESSALVLLDDDFSSIVEAVRMGRRIYDNIKKAIAYIFAIHIPIAGMSLIPVLFGLPLVLMPVHIVFLELIIDPACSTIFEAEEAESDIMQRPPRNPAEPLFSHTTVGLSILQGLIVLLMVLAVFAVSLWRGQGEAEARALTFTTLIAANIGLILTNRSWSRTILGSMKTPNLALWWVIGGAAVFMAVALYVPFFRNLFRFSILHPPDIAICCVAGILSILWFELLKVFNIRLGRHVPGRRT
ncbi:MAG: cation-translocating P-type ATPase, partial [bacterium]